MLAAAAFNNDTEPRVVARFSQWAMVSVVAIAISGGFAAWRQVGSVRAVTTTPYGRLVLYKTILFAVVLAVASVSRRLVHGDLALPAAITRRHQRSREPATALSPGPGAQARRAPAPTQARGAPAPTPARRGRARGRAQAPGQLKRAVLIELALVGVVLALAAVLVNVQPARAAASGPFSSEAAAGNDLLVDVVVDPARAGPVAFHLYTLTASGAQTDPPAVGATLTLPRPGIDNLKVPFEKAGPGHWISVGFDVPIRGRWTLQVNVRTTNVDMVAAQPIVVPIR
jgi:copper transport protein